MFNNVKIVAMTLIFVSISNLAYAFLWDKESGSVDPKVRNFSDMEDRKPTKKIDFRCDFNKIVASDFKLVSDYCETDNRSRLDYLSNFIAYDYQMILQDSNDYVMNLYHNIIKTQPLLKKFLAQYSTTEDNVKAYIFDNVSPSSFVTAYNGRLYFYLSSKDTLLRDTVYPTYKVSGLIKPEDRYKGVINKYGIKYNVRPFTISADYKENWVSAITGTPKYKTSEKLFDDGKKEAVLSYFDEIEKFIKDYGVKYYNFNEDSENIASKIYPTIFKNNDNNSIFAVGKDKEIDGIISDYLPIYKLQKIEIIARNKKSKTEQILKSFTRKEIDELYQGNNYVNGIFFDIVNSDENAYIIRYFHSVVAPQFDVPGALIREGVGLGYIYSSLGYNAVTSQEITTSYNTNDMPRACLDIAGIPELLQAKGMKEADILSIYNSFKNPSKICSEIELMVANIVIINSVAK